MARPRMLGSNVYLSDASQPMRFRGVAMRPSACKPHPLPGDLALRHLAPAVS